MLRRGAVIGCATSIAMVSLTACSDSDSGKYGKLEVTVSAEGLGANGYDFPPKSGQEVAFVDGWSVEFEHIIVAIDNIRLSKVPDKDPGDQSVVGETVIESKGPFVVDLTKAGDSIDKGGAGKVAIRLPIDEMEDKFDLEQRYAFSYDLVVPTEDSVFVNVDAKDEAVVGMIENHKRALLVGRSKFEGTSCVASDSTYHFDALPKDVSFRFALSGPVSYVNCQNPDNTGEALEGEEFQRGVQMVTSGTTTAQITVHTDHLFWPTVSHENLPLFNQFAANATETDGKYVVDLDALDSVSVPSITDSEGKALPWRSCVDEALYELPTRPEQMTFDTGSQSLTNLRDFVEFNAMTMGHLNADGLCYSQKP